MLTLGRSLAAELEPIHLTLMSRRALLLVNTNSRSGAEGCQAAKQSCSPMGSSPSTWNAKNVRISRGLSLSYADKVDLVAVGGGDGTLNAAALGVIETGLPLGILPMGTANDLARTLGIAPDIATAAGIIAAGNTRRIDLGLVNGEPFFNVASVGLSAELARRLTAEVKRRFGRLAYAFTAMNVLAQARPFRATIVSEDETVNVQTLQIAVGNGRYYGGGNAVEKNATIDDGHLDLYSLELQTGLETRPHGALVPLWRAWRLGRGAGNPREGVRGAHETPTACQRGWRDPHQHASSFLDPARRHHGVRSGWIRFSGNGLNRIASSVNRHPGA